MGKKNRLKIADAETHTSDPFGSLPPEVSGGQTSWGRSGCHEGHPELKLGNGVLLGASGYYPREGFDVYVDLTAPGVGQTSLPWETPVRIDFKISDQSVPKEVGRFKKLVTYLCTQLQDGRRVHVGCMGGHGRTGLVLSAVYKELTGDKDAIQWVRKNHCDRAVESEKQIAFLVKHYGVSDAEPAKRWGGLSFGSSNSDPWAGGTSLSLEEYMRSTGSAKPTPKPGAFQPNKKSVKCVWR